MKFPTSPVVFFFLSLMFCFFIISSVHGKVETTKELLLNDAGNSVHMEGAAKCGKEKNGDCKQGKGGAAEETVLDEDYIYTTSIVP
ncbi:hypothetical protein CCACVL1_26856 [Corchorus capsularis]|uniref:Phytosulfokine-beta n=1 Tax=Corchorus capsularis TaxID=210143 RepID=A0A1R3GD93_COCAP|nr:hypothetical protein CCACVL1_26856 [Corchorus capsularis]